MTMPIVLNQHVDDKGRTNVSVGPRIDPEALILENAQLRARLAGLREETRLQRERLATIDTSTEATLKTIEAMTPVDTEAP